MALVLDTGPIVAAMNRGDPNHQRCAAMLAGGEDFVVPGPVLVEVDYWLGKLVGPQAWADFVDDIVTGAYRVIHPSEGDLARAAELELAYADLRLGLVDATVIALCERLGETRVATLDRRHFAVVRPRHCAHLTLLPD
jgi:hypothetical protein